MQTSTASQSTTATVNALGQNSADPAEASPNGTGAPPAPERPGAKPGRRGPAKGGRSQTKQIQKKVPVPVRQLSDTQKEVCSAAAAEVHALQAKLNATIQGASEALTTAAATLAALAARVGGSPALLSATYEAYQQNAATPLSYRLSRQDVENPLQLLALLVLPGKHNIHRRTAVRAAARAASAHMHEGQFTDAQIANDPTVLALMQDWIASQGGVTRLYEAARTQAPGGGTKPLSIAIRGAACAALRGRLAAGRPALVLLTPADTGHGPPVVQDLGDLDVLPSPGMTVQQAAKAFGGKVTAAAAGGARLKVPPTAAVLAALADGRLLLAAAPSAEPAAA